LSAEGERRTEILDAAAELFASAGFRASLKDIANACGILPGSLYHHFDSKEALVVELVKRYQVELDGLADVALDDLHNGGARPISDRIIAFARAIASCAVRHRAALLQTFYEPPVGAGDELVKLARRTPAKIDATMREILEVGLDSGYLRPGIDLTMLAERLCQSMLHSGVGVFHRTRGAGEVPAVKCHMLLDGLAVTAPDATALERSNAFAAAEKVIASWADPDHDEGGPAAELEDVARSEFGRRGYEATTVRDIAGAAGMSTGTVYRLAGSKEELLASIMASYSRATMTGWEAVLDARSDPVEKLDALIWVDINLLHRFSDEFKIQLAWLRQSPPSTPNLGRSFTRRLRLAKALLAEGEGTGRFRVLGATANIRAHCLLELTWLPENIVRVAGPRVALALARDSLVRGAAA
jgi:AcrR family transcriptional regulator